MPTMPKLKVCPNCGTDENLAVYSYDSGWRHVECVKCNYLGPGEGSKIAAARSHNQRMEIERLVKEEQAKGNLVFRDEAGKPVAILDTSNL